MSVAQAVAFVERIKERTGKYPGLYCSEYRLRQMLYGRSAASAHRQALANCWLWLAQYGPKAVVPPNWPTWTLWQYTDGRIGGGPKVVEGIGPCDRSRFNGSEANLRKLWRGE